MCQLGKVPRATSIRVLCQYKLKSALTRVPCSGRRSIKYQYMGPYTVHRTAASVGKTGFGLYIFKPECHRATSKPQHSHIVIVSAIQQRRNRRILLHNRLGEGFLSSTTYATLVIHRWGCASGYCVFCHRLHDGAQAHRCPHSSSMRTFKGRSLPGVSSALMNRGPSE